MGFSRNCRPPPTHLSLHVQGRRGSQAPLWCVAPTLAFPQHGLSHHRDARGYTGSTVRRRGSREEAGLLGADGHSEVSTQEPWRCSGRWLWPRHPSCRCTIRTGK